MYKRIAVFILSLLLCFTLWNVEIKAEVNDLPVNAKAYVLIDPISGRILLEKNSEEKRAMASTTKIMTAILALEKGDLSSIVEISSKASSVGGSSFNLQAKEYLQLNSLLYGLLLPSGNDAAIAIAEHIAGTENDFVQIMNKKAVELGALDTHFNNPHGLDDPDHYTTAKDLALITRYALGCSKFREIVQTKNIQINDGKLPRHIYSTNRLLWEYKGCNGVKTGYTGQAGRCLVASAVNNNFQLISVVLGSNNHFNDSRTILDYGFDNYKLRTVIDKDNYKFPIKVRNGFCDEICLIVEESVKLPFKDNESFLLTPVVPKEVKAPVFKGEQIGQIEIIINNKNVYSKALIASSDVPLKTYNKILYEILKSWLDLK
ncbi:MAG: D-alanyl-D-alanine carboxypeptidase family protein [Tepidanaerobacteraceae bacterium]|jgi:D-alanyl-D-alanine carboxypeptidase (penicillin-binding protein 5/6)|nr:D-alanyl-D-alanine carboxypeptidase [Thermoanaerobacterales bacterium]